MKELSVGDHIIYAKQKASRSPGPRAHDISPASNGDLYSYIVDKFWTVKAVRADGKIEAVTRTGKVHQLEADDPNVHKAPILQELFNRSRFPNTDDALSS